MCEPGGSAAEAPARITAVGYRANLPADDPHCLVSERIDAPVPGPHDLLVEVQAVSINPVDTKERAGTSTDRFRVLGFDAAGTVRAVGTDVTLFAPGDDVFYAGAIDRPGSDQQLQLVDERIVGRKPATLSFAEAAALPLTSLTAWEALFDRLGLDEATTGILLVVGATGGVGARVMQLAEALLPHVTVVATASGPQRRDWVRRLGAEHVVDHRGDLVDQVRAIAPDGVDWIFTSHSEGQIDAYARLTRPFGHIVAIDDGPRDVSPLKAASIAWHWELMFTRSLRHTPDMIAQHHVLDRIAALADEGRLDPAVTRSLTPIDVQTLREAHRLVESGRTLGKVVVHGWSQPIEWAPPL